MYSKVNKVSSMTGKQKNSAVFLLRHGCDDNTENIKNQGP